MIRIVDALKATRPTNLPRLPFVVYVEQKGWHALTERLLAVTHTPELS